MVKFSYVLIDKRVGFVEAEFSYSVKKQRGGNYYIANCPELQISDQGKSKREAIENLYSSIVLSVKEYVETNNICSALEELGFKKHRMPVPDRSFYNMVPEGFNELNPINILLPLNVAIVIP